MINYQVQTLDEDVNPLTYERPYMSNLRMLISTLGEAYYVAKNVTDHAVGFTERLVFGEKYLHQRLKEYRGQKRIAFLYHGYIQARAGYERMEHFLESELFNIFAISGGYQPYSQDIRLSAEHEAHILEYVLSQVDAEEVFLIGHSQGGLVIRYMLQKMGLAKKYPQISKAITLHTPHLGTWVASLGLPHKAATATAERLLPGFPKIRGESAFQMLPGSAFLRDLNSQPLPEDVGWLSIYSYIDPLVWPARCARMPYPEATNVLLKKIGHVSPLYNIQVYELILKSMLLTPKGQRAEDSTIIDRDVLMRKRLERMGRKFEEFVQSSD